MYKDKVSTVLTYLLHFMGTAPSGIWWQQLGTDIYQLWPVYFFVFWKGKHLKNSIIDLVSVIVQNKHLPCKISP